LKTEIAIVEVEKEQTLEDVKILLEASILRINNLSIIAGNQTASP
jgi:hypothetical protein